MTTLCRFAKYIFVSVLAQNCFKGYARFWEQIGIGFIACMFVLALDLAADFFEAQQ